MDFTTGTGTDGIYIVTVVDANSYTVTDTVSGSTSGNVTQFRYIRASGNVSSITDNGTGDYTVNFTTAMPDADYMVFGLVGVNNNYILINMANSTANTINSYRIGVRDAVTNSAQDISVISTGIFR